ncbi:MAG: branched-chain amino acid ABC transporter permease [Chloroflexi bacterium]|nr:branched-chain amino acid ABC transporter permease [Chloroflexota bacterium]
MSLLVQLVLNGIVAGGIYALMSLGFGVIYNATRIFHVLAILVNALGAYIFFWLVVGVGVNPYLAFLFVIPLSALAGMVMDILAYRPIRARRGGLTTLFVVSLGLLILLQNFYAFAFGEETKVVHQGPLPAYNLFGLTVTPVHVSVLVVCAVILPVTQLFLTRTKLGRAVRALSCNSDLAVVVGVDVPRTYLVVFALGSALAGLAGALLSFDLGAQPYVGFVVILYAIVSVIVGGVGYLPGAIAGAFLLGLVQNLSLYVISVQWQDVVVFGLLFLFLVFRPQGVFGTAIVSRRF